LSYFIQYHLSVIKKAFDDLKKYLQLKTNQQEDLFRFSSLSSINERQRYVLRILLEGKKSMFIPKELATQFNISIKSARTDLQELVELGYLRTINLNKRAVGYIKSDGIEGLLE
jgi:predicted HTH transcriptional regulator